MYRIGIDLGGTKIAAGLTDDNHTLLRSLSIPTKRQRTADEISLDIASLCLRLIAEASLQKSDIAFIGIAAPGSVNPETGMAEYFCNLPFINYPLADFIRAHTGIDRVLLANDANAAALGEAVAGCTKDVSHSVLITIGTGIGGGVIINKKIYTGFNYAGGELGHIVLVHNGRPCGCGRRGCWESYSSVPALVRTTREYMKRDRSSLLWSECGGRLAAVTSYTPFTAAGKGDKTAQKVIDTYLSYLADGLTNIVNIFQPEILCLGGGLSAERSILQPLRTLVDQRQYTSRAAVKTRIEIASLGNTAGMIGAAALDIG
ncbi:MAG: ROK family protein [Ruminococcaceae bacterium]|nr:ROK family protein [Oscillospiraceae bacterium]